jgi:molybdate transport system permease protein
MSWQPLLFSLQVAATATVIATVLGTLVAALLARGKFVGRDALDALVAAPMVLPPTVLGYYLLVAIGRESAIGRAWEALTGSPLVFTRSAAVLAAAIAAFPFVVKSGRAAFEAVDPALVDAAATLGASPWRVFVTVILPLSRNGLLVGATLGFARALGDFGVTLMVAGNVPGHTQTAALAIYDAVQASRDREARAMVAVMTGVAFVALYAGTKLTRRVERAA